MYVTRDTARNFSRISKARPLVVTWELWCLNIFLTLGSLVENTGPPGVVIDLVAGAAFAQLLALAWQVRLTWEPLPLWSMGSLLPCWLFSNQKERPEVRMLGHGSALRFLAQCLTHDWLLAKSAFSFPSLKLPRFGVFIIITLCDFPSNSEVDQVLLLQQWHYVKLVFVFMCV